MADNFFKWFGRRKSVEKQVQQEPAENQVQREEEATTTKVVSQIRASVNTASTSVSVTGDEALAVNAYKRALDVLAGSVARLPLLYMKRKGTIFVPFEASPYHYLLTTEPQWNMSSYRWMFQLVWRAFHDGDAYVWPRIIDGMIQELVLVGRGCCSYDNVNGTYFISDINNGVYGTFSESEVLHVMFNTVDGYHGLPLWRLGSRVLSIAATGDRETQERFAKGGNVRGIVSNDLSQGAGVGQYGKTQIDNLANEIEDKFRYNGRNVVGVPGDAKFTPFSLSSTDMQFLDSRKFCIFEISRLTGVPPVYLYDGASSNYKEPQQTDVAYLTQTLDGILRTIETEFQRKLVGRSPGRKFSFDRKGIFAMDLNSMANYQSKTLENGIYSINDWRRYENQPPVEGGDAIYISTNRAQLGSDKLSMGANQENNNGNEEDQ